MTEKQLDILREDVRAYMDEKRYLHTLGVEKEMRYLASMLAPSLLCEAAAAGLLHDITKCFPYEKQFTYCREAGIPVDEDEMLAPALLHAKTGAHFARTHFGELATDAVIDAIARHTTAHPPLSLLGAMLFVADFTEEGRSYPDCIALRTLLHEKALSGDTGKQHFKDVLLRAVTLSLEELLASGRPIAMKTVIARNALLAKKELF